MMGFDLATAKPVAEEQPAAGFDLSTAKPVTEAAASTGPAALPAAREGWSDLPSNIPSSAGKFIGGIADAVTHPIDTVSTIGDALAGGLRNAMPAGVRDFIDKLDSPEGKASALKATEVADAVGGMYKERYGSLDKIKQTLITDPVGAMADLSTILTGGSSAAGAAGKVAGMAGAAKTASALGTTADVLSATGRATNPMVPAVAAGKLVAKGAGGVAKFGLGLTTGVGAENVSEAAKAGYAGNADFWDNMSGARSMTDVLTDAKNGLQQMRDTRLGAYKQGIMSTAADTKRLNFGAIDQKLTDLTDSIMHKGYWKIGPEEVADIDKLHEVVNKWRADPTMHDAAGLDALKQRIDAIYPSSPMHNRAARVITGVRNAVKDTIVAQVPEYAKTMADYENALNVEREIERALSLGTKASQDTAMRKLQSLSRNNVNTNYGNRLSLARQLEQQGGVQIMPSIAGQSMNSWLSRGLTGQLGNMATAGAAALGHPGAMLMMPLQSPKMVGATAYGAGRLAAGVEAAAGKTGITPAMGRAAGLGASQAGVIGETGAPAENRPADPAARGQEITSQITQAMAAGRWDEASPEAKALRAEQASLELQKRVQANPDPLRLRETSGAQ